MWDITVNKEKCLAFLEKGILVNLSIFAFSCSISKAATSISGGLICLFWLTKLIITKNYRFQISPLGLPYLIFIAAVFISGIDAWNARTLDKTGTFLWMALFYFAIINTKIDLNTVKQLSYLILASMLISSIFGLYEHHILNVSRISAFCGPLAFGNLLSIVLLFVITFALWGEFEKKYKILLSLSVLLFGSNLLFTQARGAWLGFLGALFVLFWLKNKKLLLILVIIFIGLLMLFPPVYVERFYSSFDTESNTSNLTRLGLWKGALLMFRDHPINGVGIGNFSKMYETTYRQRNSGATVHAHNNFLHYMAETGISGLFAFTWLMLAALLLLYRNYKVNPDPQWRLYFLASFCAVILFNIQGLTENTFGDAETIRFFWFLLGLNLAIKNEFGEYSSSARSKHQPDTNLLKYNI